MNTPELSPEPKAETSSGELIAALQGQVFILLVALIVVTGTLTVYLYRQTTFLRKDIEQMRPPILALENNKALYMSFLDQLGAYAQTHPDFRPVLTKYGIPVTPTAPRR
jgi:hypothetical protein